MCLPRCLRGLMRSLSSRGAGQLRPAPRALSPRENAIGPPVYPLAWIILQMPRFHVRQELQGSGVVSERRISRVIQGATLQGTYSVQGSTVTVNTPIGSKSAPVLRGSKASSLAYLMLGELYYEASPCSRSEQDWQ
jgi:hypothetical protein